MSKENQYQKRLNPWPKVTVEVLEKVRRACEACSEEERKKDIFWSCLRDYGASAAEVTSVLQHVKPDLGDTEVVTIGSFLEAILSLDKNAILGKAA